MKRTQAMLANDQIINDIISQETIRTLYQPIISIKKGIIVGFEAVSRGFYNDNVIPPYDLFYHAKRNGTALELDRVCRKKAVENFVSHLNGNTNHILSLNIESSILNEGRKSNHLLNMVNGYGLDPSRIIIEILESDIEDAAILSDFVERYRKNSFLIAIDDVGSGFSNFSRIINLKPDIIKIDRSLISGIENNFCSREVVRSLVSMSHGIGASVIAEGIETENEALICLELGTDLLQGFYFSRPEEPGELPADIQQTIESVGRNFRNRFIQKVLKKKETANAYGAIIDSVLATLISADTNAFNTILEVAANEHASIECCYILNSNGIQISNTVCESTNAKNKTGFFCPDLPGADQSFKEYFFSLKSGLERYTSSPYISGATGRLCLTMSATFSHTDGKQYVLCCDMSCTDTMDI
jgi:EAL domain-containing protein (putative c-di-GMP-specific phosphodiesterase class I)